MNKVTVYDTTLRDGAQTEGISYSINDKVRIVRQLDELGIHYIEAGWPANTKDIELFKTLAKQKLQTAQVVAFGSTRRANTDVKHDQIIRYLLEAETDVVTVFGKSWDLHVKDVLKTTLEENLQMIHDSVSYLKSKGKKVFYDAEHFFDAFKANKEYALQTLTAAQSAGAETIILCDTNGGTLTSQLVSIVQEVKSVIEIPLGIHTHNDSSMAVANSIAAVEHGCVQVQGTFNGLGERCGNADLVSVIAILKLKLGIPCVTDEQLQQLTKTAHVISEISNMKQMTNQPFVGQSAFAHKGGIHINAVLKNTVSYEHIKPELVGNHRRILVSELAGRSPILIKAKELGLDLDSKSPKVQKMLKTLQDLEHQGYQFEAADASFELFVKKELKKSARHFTLDSFKVVVEKRTADRVYSEATIKLKVNGVPEHTVAEGDGPVNALDNALRKALVKFYPGLSKMHLSDFKVRVLDEKEGTAAKVRVLIQSQDASDSWTTVGVSENIIQASWQALLDSVEYKLLKDSESTPDYKTAR